MSETTMTTDELDEIMVAFVLAFERTAAAARKAERAAAEEDGVTGREARRITLRSLAGIMIDLASALELQDLREALAGVEARGDDEARKFLTRYRRAQALGDKRKG